MSVDSMIGKFQSLSKSCGDDGKVLIEQISLLEGYLLSEGFQLEEHGNQDKINDFYYNPDKDVVFVVYYSRFSELAAYAMMDKKVFDKYFRGRRKKVAFSIRNDGNYKAVVSMHGTYVPLSHLAVDFEYDGNNCVDHILSNIWINTSDFLRICTVAENNKNKRNRKNKSGSEFDYNPAMDFRDNWWLIPMATMLHVITMEEAVDYNRRLSNAD